MKAKTLAIGFGLAAATFAGAASAHTDIGLYLGVPGPVYEAPPVVYQAPPVVYERPAYYGPRPVYYENEGRRGWDHRDWDHRRWDGDDHDHGRGHGHGHHGDRD